MFEYTCDNCSNVIGIYPTGMLIYVDEYQIECADCNIIGCLDCMNIFDRCEECQDRYEWENPKISLDKPKDSV